MMKRQLKYQLFLGRKAKFSWIILLVLALFAVVVHVLNHLQYLGVIQLEELAIGAEMYPRMSFLDIVLNFYYSDKIMLFVGVFVVLFVLMEFRGGFIKAIHSPFISPVRVVTAKLAVILIFIAISFLVVFFITGVFAATFLRHDGFGNFGRFLVLTLIQIFIEFSFSVVIMFYCLAVKNVLWGLFGTLLYIMFAPVSVYQLIDLIARQLFKAEGFVIARYLPYGNTYQLTPFDSGQHFLIALISGIIFLAVFYWGNIMLLKEKDIL